MIAAARRQHGARTLYSGDANTTSLIGKDPFDFPIGSPPKLHAETYTLIVRRQKRSRGGVREADVPRLVGIIPQDINPQPPARSAWL